MHFPLLRCEAMQQRRVREELTRRRCKRFGYEGSAAPDASQP
jgi:hypothetical protein